MAEDQQHTVSVVLYGGPLAADAAEDAPQPASTDKIAYATHIGIGVHTATPSPRTCFLHHARSPSQIRFIYDPRPAQPFFGQDPVIRARCELRTADAAAAQRANAVLAAYGADDANLPWFGEGNCHDWMAGAVRALEAAELVGAGIGAFWTDMVGKGPVAMSRAWSARGGTVVFNEAFGRGGNAAAPPDARWMDGEERLVGRLDGGRVAGLAALVGGASERARHGSWASEVI